MAFRFNHAQACWPDVAARLDLGVVVSGAEGPHLWQAALLGTLRHL
jgi:hypothetical protein